MPTVLYYIAVYTCSLVFICGFGIMFLGLVIILLVVLDLILIIPNRDNLKTLLIIEWAIISSPFVYWSVKYDEWIFVAAIIAFFIHNYCEKNV